MRKAFKHLRRFITSMNVKYTCKSLQGVCRLYEILKIKYSYYHNLTGFKKPSKRSQPAISSLEPNIYTN